MKEKDVEITKTTVECYKLRCLNNWWADITIDANGTTGRIQIASDYGSWQFYWGACGEPFKEFLTGLDKHYVAGKLGASKWFNLEATIIEYRSVIEANIQDGDLTATKGADALDELDQLKDCGDQFEFYRCLEDCSEIMRLYDHCPSLIYGIDPSFNKFWAEAWPVLIECFKKEEVNLQP